MGIEVKKEAKLASELMSILYDLKLERCKGKIALIAGDRIIACLTYSEDIALCVHARKSDNVLKVLRSYEFPILNLAYILLPERW
jgi:hypothetical protein